MAFLTLTIVFSFCLCTSFAGHAPHCEPHNHGSQTQSLAPNIRLNLNSPNFALERPSVHLQGEQLQQQRHLFLHNVNSQSPSPRIPIVVAAYTSPSTVDSGYHNGNQNGNHNGKLNPEINHVHERPTFVRYPIVFASDLIANQDDLEKIHHLHRGLAIGGLGHSVQTRHSVGEYSIPLSRGIQGGTLNHGRGLTHEQGYNARLTADQPRIIYRHADNGHASGRNLGDSVLYGRVLHEDALHGRASLKKY